MKFSEEAMLLLKNFATMSEGYLFQKGNVLRAVNGDRSTMAKATVIDEIPQDFCIGNLNKFLSVLTLDEEATMEFDSKSVYIIGNKGRSKITYRFADMENQEVPAPNGYVLPTEEIKFDLTEEDFKWIMRSATILQSPHIGVIGDGKNVYLKTLNVHDDSVNTESLDLGAFPAPQNTIRLIMKTSNWIFIPGPYEVTLSKGIGRFSHKVKNLTYWIALEAS